MTAGELPDPALRTLARRFGIQASFKDWKGNRRFASRRAVAAALEALGAEPGAPNAQPQGPPVVVAWDGLLPDGRILPPGVHRLRRARGEPETLAVSAPSRCPAPPRRAWGAFLPLYALRARGGGPVGTYSDLAALCEWVGSLGGSLLGTLPLCAQFLDRPFEPSPYAPASRLFWNELSIDLRTVPELAVSPSARDLLPAATRTGRSRLVDYREAWRVKRPVLEALARGFFRDGSTERRRAFRGYRQERPELEDYARFRAFGERTGRRWQEWPSRQRAGRIGPRDADLERVRFHEYVQWVADEQLSAIESRETDGDAAARTVGHFAAGLFLDLPLGVHSSSYDTWRYRDAFAWGVSAGAPPDAFFTRGQDWGFPPQHPVHIREDGFEYFRRSLRHLFRRARAVRIDHVLGFHRMYWVSPGLGPDDGVYVRYPAEALYAILSLEAGRAGVAVVGEDLGTVPRAVRAAMRRHGLLRSFMAQIEASPDRSPPLPPAPAGSLAALGTHDMPTFAGFWLGLDVEDRLRQGLLDEGEAEAERRARGRLCTALVRQLRAEGLLPRTGSPEPEAVLRALLRHLAAGQEAVVAVSLEDLWLEPEPHNRPGTTGGANWRRRAAWTFEGVRSDPEVLGTLREVDRLRREPAEPNRRRRERATSKRGNHEQNDH